MKANSTDNRYDIADELGVPNEFIENITVYPGGLLRFSVKGETWYTSRLTKTGRHKKNSIRID